MDLSGLTDQSFLNVVKELVRTDDRWKKPCFNAVSGHNEEGITFLMIASLKNHHSSVEFLLKNGADPNIQTSEGRTALIMASDYGHEKCVELLLNYRADPNIQDIYGQIPLMYAVDYGNLRCIKLLLDGGSDTSVEGKKAIDFTMNKEIKELLSLPGPKRAEK